MRVASVRRALAPWLLALAAAGCTATSVTRWETREAARLRAEARSRGEGAWVSLSFELGAAGRDASGELIAVGADSLVLLVDGALVAIPTATLGAARIEIQEDFASRPIMRIAPRVMVRPSADQWKELAQFARFPQGLSAEAERRLRSPAGAARDSGDASSTP